MDLSESGTLSPVEVRVLGSLLEKEMTTPDYYPLTVNALMLACNQSSNRDPVVSYDEATVMRALDSLRDRRLAFLFGGANSRVPRYGHKLESSEFGRPELAVLCVLLLRGPQTVGEIKGRTGRMYEFESLEAVEEVLKHLAERTTGGALVARLPRQAGFKESRYTQLLGGAPSPEPRSEVQAGSGASAGLRPDGPRPVEEDRIGRLEAEVAALRQELTELRRELEQFRGQFQ